MASDARMTISRRGLLASMAAIAAGAVASVATRAERALAAGSDGEAVAVGARYDDVRSSTRFRTSRHDTTVMAFGATDGSAYQHSVEIGADGIRAAQRGHWSHQSVTIDGTVEATGAGAAAAGVGPMIVGKGDVMGVFGSADGEGPGVMGSGVVGVEGIGERGGLFAGNTAQLRLQPSESPSHPRRGEAGDLFVDRSRRLWFCRGGADWKQVA